MKDFNKSDYSINKNSKNIVYISHATGANEITLDKFLASDSNLTKEDYDYWKNWSDEKYQEEELKTRRATRNNTSIEAMTEIMSFVSNNLEDDYENIRFESAAKEALSVALKKLYSDKKFSEKMKARFEQYYFKNLSTCEIAKREGVNSKTVSESINSVVKKLSKYFYESFKA